MHHVSDDRIAEFANALWTVSGNSVIRKSSNWESVIQDLKTYFFHLRALPLPSNAEELLSPGAIKRLEGLVNRAAASYPQVADAAETLMASVVDLRGSDYSPLMDDLRLWLDIVREQSMQKGAILLKTRAHLSAVRAAIDEMTGGCTPEVVYHRDIREAEYESICIVGRPWWFPNSLFRCPPAMDVNVFSFVWHRDSIDVDPVLDFGKPVSGPRPQVQVLQLESQTAEPSVEANLDELDPITDWQSILKSTSASGTDSIHTREKARLYLLEDQIAVPMPAGPGHKIMVLELDGEAPEPTYRSVTEVYPGEFVVLRTEGSGDLLIPVANKLLGNSAKEVREKQKRWKNRLKAHVEKKDLLTVAVELLDLGSENANEANVRNWMSSDRIKPGSRSDFAAIMKLVGLEQREEEYWKAMEMIVSAHRSAGHRITDFLLEKVRNVDIENLQRRGRVDFNLAEEEGMMMAIRIREISDEIFEVAPHQMRVPFPLDA